VARYNKHFIAHFLYLGAIALSAQLFLSSASAQGAGEVSSICKFNAGPRAGQTQDYAPMAPIPVGSACQDGMSSTGVVIARSGAKTSQSGPSSSASQGMTLTCRFTGGPRAGQTQDYSGVPGAKPAKIGSPCTDGVSSNGIAISPSTSTDTDSNDSDTASDSTDDAAGSTICQFTYGAKKNGWHDYAPMRAKPVGSTCQDGMGSAGTVVKVGHGTEY
jgi:hypothetical protein